jgi:hypothetical protein
MFGLERSKRHLGGLDVTLGLGFFMVVVIFEDGLA